MAREQAATFRIEALDRASKVLNGVSNKLGRVGDSASKLGKRMTAALTVPIGLIGVKSASTFADFELSMAKVKAVSGATGEVFQALEGDARRLGSATKFSASEVSKLQLAFSKLGFDPSEILKATESTLALAQATDEELGAAAAVAGGTLRGFRLDAAETSRVTDVMALSFSSSALDLEKFSESMKYVAPNAAEAGVSLEETTAMLSVLANNMVDGSQAGTSLRRVLNVLAKQGGPVGESLEKLGKKNIGLAEAEALVGKNAQTALLILAKNSDKIKELAQSYDGAAGAAKDMAAIMDNTLAGTFAKLKSATEAAAITIGRNLTPVLVPIIEKVTVFAAAVGKADPALVALGITLAGVAAAAGPALLVLGGMISAVGTLAGVFSTVAAAVAGVSFAPIIAGVAAVVGVVAAVVQATGGWGATLKRLQAVGAELAPKFVAVWQQIKQAGTAAWELISDSVGRLVRPLQGILQLVGVDLSGGVGGLGKVFGFVLGAIEKQLFVVTKVIQGISVALSGLEVAGLAAALGLVRGFGRAVNSVAEFVNSGIGGVERLINNASGAIATLVNDSMRGLAATVVPFINSILESMNQLTGTDFEPLKLSVEGMEGLNVDLGRVSVGGFNEGAAKVEAGMSRMLAEAQTRLADDVQQLVTANLGKRNEGPSAAEIVKGAMEEQNKELHQLSQAQSQFAQQYAKVMRASGEQTTRTALETARLGAAQNGRLMEHNGRINALAAQVGAMSVPHK